jgi:hypothetical protein
MNGRAPPAPRHLWWALPATILLLVPLPFGALAQRWPALVNAFQNVAHVPLFAAVTLLICAVFDWRAPAARRRNLCLAIVLAIGCGGLSEYLQAQLGRDSSWADLGNDALGVAIAVLYRLAGDARSRQQITLRRAAMAGAVALAVLAAGPPAWTTAAYIERWRSAPVIWREDSRLLRLFSPVQRWASPVLYLAEVPHDWRHVAAVGIDAANLSAATLLITVRVHDALHDQQHADRYNEAFALAPGERRLLTIPVERIRDAPAGRRMDLARMRAMAIFQEPRGAQLFRVREIRLMPHAPTDPTMAR